jgi:hypothetical protein
MALPTYDMSNTTPTTMASNANILGGTRTNPVTTSSIAAPGTGQTAGGGGGNLLQGAANPLVTSTSSTVTGAPSWYTDYLNQLSTQGQNAAQNSQFVGATDLQNQAFNQVGQNVGNYQPALSSATNLAQNVGSSNLYQAIGDLGEANIRRNLAPRATAGIVGSGQFGSSRGALALGDTIANAELGITAQQAQAKQQDIANQLAASQQLGNLAGQTQALGLGDVNALATLGGQKQTIGQNEQLFPMQQLVNESSLLRNYTIPTSVSMSETTPAVSSQMQNSPLANYLAIAGTANNLTGGVMGQSLFGTKASIDPKTGATIPGLPGVLGSLSKYLGEKFTSNPTNTNNVSMDNINPIKTSGGETLTPRGDGTYTNSSGQTVDSDGTLIVNPYDSNNYGDG